MRNKLLGAAAGAALLVVAVGGTANATPAYGVADIVFSNFQLIGILGQNIIDDTVTTGASSNYPGSSASQSGNGSLTGGVPLLTAFSGPCATCTPGTFTPVLGPLTSANPGSQAQVSIVGPINNAVSSEISESNLTLGGSVSGGQTNTNTGIDIIFLASTTQISLGFTVADLVSAAVGALNDGASAKISASYTLTDVTDPNNPVVIDDQTPLSLNSGVTVSNPAFPKSISLAPTPFLFTDNVIPGDIYSISLQSQTSVQLSTVPEPLSVAILGSGLFALGVVRRRKKV